MPTTPLLIYDNFCDTVALHTDAQLSASEEPDGYESFRVADYRRDRTYWQPATDGGGVDHYIKVQLAGATSATALIIDRNSNLDGKTVYIEGSLDGAVWGLSQAINIPAAGVLGGSPIWPSMARTEEGVVWGIANLAFAPRLYWRLRIPYQAAFRPLITGLTIGASTQLLGYSAIFDEDAGERTQSSEVSTAGYRGSAKSFAWRTSELSLGTIGSAEYDNTMRVIRDALFVRQVPYFLLMDYVTHPERGWLFEYDGTGWNMSKSRALRSGRIRGREVGAKIV